MLIFGKHFSAHRPLCLLVLAGTVLAFSWYGIEWYFSGRLPGGSSRPGFAFGVLGGLIIVFEFLLWPRKKVRSWRLGRGQTWLRAHIWLGLFSVPLILLHSGFHWGGTLSTILALVFIAVILSGIFGLALQQFLPRMMLEQVPAETIYSQIDHVAGQLRYDAEDLVIATCGPPPDGQATFRGSRQDEPEPTSYVTVGAMRTVGSVQGKVLQTVIPATAVPNTELLRDVFYNTIAPFLIDGSKLSSPLGHPVKAASWFKDLRTRLNPAAEPAIAALETMADQRRQFDRQARLHVWLHAWVLVHLPLSVVLVLLMIEHAIFAIKYW